MGHCLLFRIAVSSLVAGTALSSCAVGPDYHSPEAPNTKSYTAATMPEETAATSGTGGAAQRFISGQEIPAQWWTLFHSELLDQLIRQALQDSPTLTAAQATLRASQENYLAVYGGSIYPSVDANILGRRQKISGVAVGQPNTQTSPFNLYNASVNVSYSLDLFGGARRELEALQSQVDYQRFQLEGAYLALTANIVTTAVREASLRAQILATQDILKAQEQQFEVVDNQFQLGAVSRSDVLAQQTQLAQTRTTLPPLEVALAQTRHQLAVLSGKLPSEAVLPEFQLDELQLPQELPVSLPSSLVQQRPDVRASEALLHQASAQIGVATAGMFPQFTLTGSYGSTTGNSRDLFSSGTSVWSIGAELLQPIFHGGQLSAERRAAVAVYDQAAAQYRETVLLAFQNVADVLRALDADASTLKAQVEAETAAHDALELTQKQFELGAVSYLSMLNAERQYQQALVSLVQAQAARYADTAALFQALGGGWWNRAGKTEATATAVTN